MYQKLRCFLGSLRSPRGAVEVRTTVARALLVRSSLRSREPTVRDAGGRGRVLARLVESSRCLPAISPPRVQGRAAALSRGWSVRDTSANHRCWIDQRRMITIAPPPVRRFASRQDGFLVQLASRTCAALLSKFAISHFIGSPGRNLWLVSTARLCGRYRAAGRAPLHRHAGRLGSRDILGH